MNVFRLTIAALVGLFLPSLGSAVTTYNTQAEFLAAIGGSANISENFNSFTSDVSLGNTTFDVGPFQITHSGTAFNNQPLIDAAPFNFSDSVNGTSMLNLFTNPVTTVSITFDEAINAFGATFKSIQSITTLDFTTSNGPTSLSTGGFVDSGFFGFTLDAGESLTSISFVNTVTGDGLFMDDILASSATPAVPLPASLPLFLLGLGGLALSRRKKD